MEPYQSKSFLHTMSSTIQLFVILFSIPNWNELTENERLNIARLIVKRNKQRLAELQRNPPSKEHEDCEEDDGDKTVLLLEDFKKVEEKNECIINSLEKYTSNTGS